MQTVYAWQKIPDANELTDFLNTHPEEKLLVFRLPENRILPDFPQNSALFCAWQHATRCVQFDNANFIADFWVKTDLLLLPYPLLATLGDYVQQPIHWQTQPIELQEKTKEKIWQKPPSHLHSGSLNVLIIGAGIAGAACAFELAKRNVPVTVLEAENDVAQLGSGNQQGLLYAKISPHLTAQTALLLAGYGYTRRLLEQLLPKQDTWQASGVVHLNHNESETKRNAQLAQHTHHAHLYHAVSAKEVSHIAGIHCQESGLFWPQGAWINPKSLVQRLLQHPNIQVHCQQHIQTIQHDGQLWHIQSQTQHFSGSHIVFCTGAQSDSLPIIRDFPIQKIRGQTSIAAACAYSNALKTALSGASYISPTWQNQHCFGATFINNDSSNSWRSSDEEDNWQQLNQLNPALYRELKHATSSFSGSLKGHAAVRCDSYDHLPIVGALGDVAAMRTVYKAYALDKNYRINTPCPYLPHAYANIAHGSRGLATAPICAAQIAAQICQTPFVLPLATRQALLPNRLIIRQIVHHQAF